MITHIPVLTNEVIKYLNPKPNQNFIDCTIGEGGHTLAILEKNGPSGKALGIDQDPDQIENCKLRIENFKERVILVQGNFKNLKTIIENNCLEWRRRVSGILFDLGMSSWHLERGGRGFSFLKDEILDMRFDKRETLTAREIINLWPESEIEKIIREYSQERYSRKISKAIIEERKKRPILNTFKLAEIIKRTVPINYEKSRIHPATRTFQALRIAVNKELDNLKEVLPQAIDILNEEGKIVIISFHSLEDRIVKNFFREEEKKGRIKILTKKPIRASEDEIRINLRSRSAKLRAAVKIV